MVFSNTLLAGSAAQGGSVYSIDQSIRFNQADNASMSRTPSSASSRTTWTFSWWWKRGNLSGSTNGTNQRQPIFGTTAFSILSNHNSTQIDGINVVYTGSANDIQTSEKYRDVSAWYHFVFVLDTTNDVASERARLYKNGERVTSFASITYPSKDTTYTVNNTQAHYIGFRSSGENLDGYLAEINFVDGYAYGPEYFGQFQEDTSIWIPIKYSSSYGSNGFYLKGSNSGSLGADSSGNGNNFTTSGLAANDQRIDTPTNNQITFNPLNNQRSGGTLTNGNLDYTGPSTRTLITLTANLPSSGKWAVAFKATDNSTQEWNFGIILSTDPDLGDAAGSNEDIGAGSAGIKMNPSSNDLEIYDYKNSAAIDPSLPITTDDEFWIAVDKDSSPVKIFMGIYDESASAMKFVAADTGLDGNPATGDNPTTTLSDMIGSNEYTFAVGSKDTSNDIYLQRSTDVSGTTPSGYTYFENVKDLL